MFSCVLWLYKNRIFFTYLYLDNTTGMTHLKISISVPCTPLRLWLSSFPSCLSDILRLGETRRMKHPSSEIVTCYPTAGTVTASIRLCGQSKCIPPGQSWEAPCGHCSVAWHDTETRVISTLQQCTTCTFQSRANYVIWFSKRTVNEPEVSVQRNIICYMGLSVIAQSIQWLRHRQCDENYEYSGVW